MTRRVRSLSGLSGEVDDLRRQKLWVRTGDPDETAAWQKAGFRVVPLSASEIMSSLTSGVRPL